MAPTLEYVFTMREYLHPDMADVGPKLSGPTRLMANVTEGFLKFTDPEIEAQIIPPGGDWPLIDYVANVLHVNARARAKTDQGEMYIHYTGALVMDEGTKKLLAKSPDAKATNFGDTTWFTNIDVETTDQRLKWMETNMLVGQGRWHIDEKGLAAEYLVYKVKN
ncbi:uncharacterized protein GGS22DRAFT_152655 [Annulohypoxylon maeteangense]|uniref:uncharacterized protein n=1 Tax=Annulohypoxylon maeteangense TaxID=1927788 RepID=UPI002008076F|nr:uncharacterized protein GGS22DRAFT_152655 [Annulohypoxylon maeteangense]KAI0888900.1 hypothetical protein GGS22DRAFT_152655 [Annulohypoxylon maeteangense]